MNGDEWIGGNKGCWVLRFFNHSDQGFAFRRIASVCVCDWVDLCYDCCEWDRLGWDGIGWMMMVAMKETCSIFVVARLVSLLLLLTLHMTCSEKKKVCRAYVLICCYPVPMYTLSLSTQSNGTGNALCLSSCPVLPQIQVECLETTSQSCSSSTTSTRQLKSPSPTHDQA